MSQCISHRTKWQRVSRRHPCPVCEHSDWCLVTGPADSPDAVICARVESDKRVGTKGAGWLHRLRDDDQWCDRPRQRRVKIDTAADPTIDFDRLAETYEAAISGDCVTLLARELGVTGDSLLRLQVGWSEYHRSFSFPMRDRAEDGIARGIRLRRTDGSKWAVKGSRQGLFVPRHFPIGDTLVVCEGETDTAAMLMLGFDAVGRPSCNGGVGLIVDLAERHHFTGAVIVADADAPGQRGARYLASRLVGYVPDGVRIVTPPAKDARDWLQQGANRLDVLDAIEAAPTMMLTYSRRAVV